MKKTVANWMLITLAALATGQAMAASSTTAGAEYDALHATMNTPSTLTREQVQAELFAYRAAHKDDFIDYSTGVNLTDLRKQMGQTSGKTREQVRAELMESRRNPSAQNLGN